jgi:hypothetical protein
MVLVLFSQLSPADDSLDQLRSAERSARMGTGVANTVIGLSLVIAPQFSDSLSGSSKAFFALGGVAVLMNGVKNFIVPTQTERMMESYSLLRENPRADAATRKHYEDAFFRDVASSSRSARHWQAGISFAAGTTSLIAGTLLENEFAKTFTIVLGAASIVGGGFALFRESPAEKVADRHFESPQVALFTARGEAVPGATWIFQF